MERKFVYTRQKHFTSMLDKMSGKSSIPAEAIKYVKSYMKDKEIEPHELTKYHVKTALKHSQRKWLPLLIDIHTAITQPCSSYKKEQISFDHKEKSGTCAICLEEDSNAVLKCKHTFHEDCIGEWNNVCRKAGKETRCPYCNSILEIEVITYPLKDNHKEILAKIAIEKYIKFESEWRNNPENGKNMPPFDILAHVFWTEAIQENIQNLVQKF